MLDCATENHCAEIVRTLGAIIFFDSVSIISETMCWIINPGGHSGPIGTYWTHLHRDSGGGMVLFAGNSHQSSQLDIDKNDQFNTVLWSIQRKGWCLKGAEIWMWSMFISSSLSQDKWPKPDKFEPCAVKGIYLGPTTDATWALTKSGLQLGTRFI